MNSKILAEVKSKQRRKNVVRHILQSSDFVTLPQRWQ